MAAASHKSGPLPLRLVPAALGADLCVPWLRITRDDRSDELWRANDLQPVWYQHA